MNKVLASGGTTQSTFNNAVKSISIGFLARLVVLVVLVVYFISDGSIQNTGLTGVGIVVATFIAESLKS